MLGTGIIVFREVLEAALIVGIVMAASAGAPRRGVWVSCGLAAGVAGAALVALFAAKIAAAAAGIGQELSKTMGATVIAPDVDTNIRSIKVAFDEGGKARFEVKYSNDNVRKTYSKGNPEA